MTTDASTTPDVVVQRIYNEFLEMPGLRVTSEQAQRLWGLDRDTCLTVLGALVDSSFLYRTSRGMYARLTDGRTERPRRHGTHWR
jgi:hypothetical protein